MSFSKLGPVARLMGSTGLVAIPLLSVLVARSAAAAPRIVCIGEQTTLTTEMSPTWPAKMQTDLGAAYTVTDDGDGNGTVLSGSKGGTHTFTTPTNAPFKDSIMAPDIVVIGPWAEHDEIAVKGGANAAGFQTDYDALVMAYLNLPTKPCVIVTTPVNNPSYQQNPDTDLLVTNTIEPAVLAVAAAHSLKVVDLYTTFAGQTAWLGPDGHFTAAGAAQVATMVEAALPSCSSGTGGTGAGGTGGTGGTGAGGIGSGGSPSSGGSPGSGGSPAASGGSTATGTGGTSSSAGGTSSSSGGSASTTPPNGSAGSSTATGSPASSSDSGGCAVASRPASGTPASWLLLMGSVLLLRRRRASRPAT